MSRNIANEVVEKVTATGRETLGSTQLMTPEQCAALLQVEVTTLYVMKSQGRIPYRKVGHLLRFDLNEIIEWTKPKSKQLS